MEDVAVELQVASFAETYLALACHAVQEELEDEFFLFCAGIEELRHVFRRIWNDHCGREGHFLQDRLAALMPNELRNVLTACIAL